MSDVDINWFAIAFIDDVIGVNEKAATKAALIVERTAKKSFGHGASRIGKEVTVKRGKKRRRPSAPGFAPNVDYGILKSSVKHIKGKLIGNEIAAFTGSDIDKIDKGLLKRGVITDGSIWSSVQYGYFLEVGTKYMEARPWLRPALKQNESRILQIFKKANS